ncbi:MAG: sulfite exporter TauE/SafE family protein [Erysipelotrichaceae bacterium]|nr:sulfite exporter TauE/SafE family protein [Erysipelotrichaceae bacterium]
MNLIFIAVALFASIIGALCGIGGGVLIKPILDMTGLMSASSISFLSGCTVLSMALYSVIRTFITKEENINLKSSVPLGIGAAIGGLFGKSLFRYVETLYGSSSFIYVIQSTVLAVLVFMTLIYTLNKDKIRSLNIHNSLIIIFIGLILGIISSFLGIGGGPFNLAVLFFFFSMETKEAAINSLMIIVFSQITSLISTIVTGSFPPFTYTVLLLMMMSGTGGGIIGRHINKKVDSKIIEKTLVVSMILIIVICIFNITKYA